MTRLRLSATVIVASLAASLTSITGCSNDGSREDDSQGEVGTAGGLGEGTLSTTSGGGGSGDPLQTSGTTRTDSGPSGSETANDSTASDPCMGIELPLCHYCPNNFELCGQPCRQADQRCSNDIGDDMECVDGQWQCSIHPPLGEDCNLVCMPADGCTELDCVDGLMVELTALEGFVAGIYTVYSTLDDGDEACTIVISDDPGVCPGGVPCVDQSNCNALYGLAQEPPFISLSYPLTLQISLTIERDEVVLIEQTHTPAYELDAPNGPGCLPVCAQATVGMTL